MGYVEMDTYTDTVTELARLAGVNGTTIRVYADEGLLDFVRASNGTRLFKTGQAERVRELIEQRIARRGNRTKAATA